MRVLTEKPVVFLNEDRVAFTRFSFQSRQVENPGSSAPLGSHAAEIYAKFAADHADKDFSAVIEMIRKG